MPRKARLGQQIEANWYELGGGEEWEGKGDWRQEMHNLEQMLEQLERNNC